MTEKDFAAKLAEIAEAAELEEDHDDDVWVRPAPPRDPSQVYSVRISVTEIEKLRQVAEHKGVTPSALMRTWVLIRLDAEYEAMLGICPRCGRPSEQMTGTNPIIELARAASAKTTGRAAAAKAPAKRATTAKKAPARKLAKTAKTAGKATGKIPPRKATRGSS